MWQLVETYYQEATTQEQKVYPLGHIYTAPCFYLDPDFKVLHPRVDPYHKRPAIFEIDKPNESSFHHDPVLKPKLESDEAFIPFKAKRRPVVIISQRPAAIGVRTGRDREPDYLIAPLYSLKSYDPPGWRAKIRAFAYPELFYLPSDDQLGMQEGYIRLDRIHAMPQRWLKRCRLRMTQHAYNLLTLWLQHYITGYCEPVLAEYRHEQLCTIEACEAFVLDYDTEFTKVECRQCKENALVPPDGDKAYCPKCNIVAL